MSFDTVLRRIYGSVRLALSGLFLYAGYNKALDLNAFAQVINDFGLVPEALVFPVAVILVAAEIITALALVLEIRGGLRCLTLF
ncbi:MAG: DoxX family membrane protein, partial [Candidatus Electrothrix sp. ATG2]|nr:DoxX family membrane protein [Candidatus Electrothrix sp. ATG2]